MDRNDLIADLMLKLNENQLAIAAAVEELAKWVEDRGSVVVANNARTALSLLDENHLFITDGITRLQSA